MEQIRFVFWGISNGRVPQMAEEGKPTYKIKHQLSRFGGRLTEGWGKVASRFIGEMLYGIQAAGDVKVSEAKELLEAAKDHLRLGPRKFNSELELEVWADIEGDQEKVGTPPADAPLEIPRCEWWQVRPEAGFFGIDWDSLALEVGAKDMPWAFARGHGGHQPGPRPPGGAEELAMA